MNRNDRQKELGGDDQETVERRASHSQEPPTNVTRSTEDLTVGGTEKDPDSYGPANRQGHAASTERTRRPPVKPTEEPAEGLSSSEQAVVRQARALESGEESPG